MPTCNYVLILIMSASSSQQNSGSTDPTKATVVYSALILLSDYTSTREPQAGLRSRDPRPSSQCLTVYAIVEKANDTSPTSPSNLISTGIFAAHLQGHHTKPPKPSCTFFTSQDVRTQQHPISRPSTFPGPAHSGRLR